MSPMLTDAEHPLMLLLANHVLFREMPFAHFKVSCCVGVHYIFGMLTAYTVEIPSLFCRLPFTLQMVSCAGQNTCSLVR